VNTPIPRELYDLIDIIAKQFNPDCIILWGSRARGDYSPASDYDLIVIAPFKVIFLDRLKQLIAIAPLSPNFEILGYTATEFEAMFGRGNVTALDAISEGIPLVGEAFFARYTKRFEAWVTKGLERTSCSWKIPQLIS
jgi:hypothetical protein